MNRYNPILKKRMKQENPEKKIFDTILNEMYREVGSIEEIKDLIKYRKLFFKKTLALAEQEFEKKDWNWMYQKNQDKIWLEILRNLEHWKKNGYKSPDTYFTDGIYRYIALEIRDAYNKGIEEQQKQVEKEDFKDGYRRIGCPFCHKEFNLWFELSKEHKKKIRELKQQQQKKIEELKKLIEKHVDFNYGKEGHGFLIKESGNALIFVKELKKKFEGEKR